MNADGSLMSLDEAKDAIVSGVPARLDPDLIDNISFPLLYGSTIVIPASADAFFPEYLELPRDYDIMLSEDNGTYEIIDGVLYDRAKEELVFIFDNTPRTEFHGSSSKSYVSDLSVSFGYETTEPLVIPEGTRSIGKACIYSNPYVAATSGEKQLQVMILPDSLEYIDPEAFMNGKPLCIMVGDNDNLNIKGCLLFSEDGKTLITAIAPDETIYEDFSFQDGDTIFYQYLDIMVGDIPEGTEVIGPFALSGIQSESGSTIIPSSVRKIGDYAFWNARFSGSLVIPESVEEVGEGGFWGINVREFSVMSDDTDIPYDAFRYSTEGNISQYQYPSFF